MRKHFARIGHLQAAFRSRLPTQFIVALLAVITAAPPAHPQKMTSLDAFMGRLGADCFSGEGFNMFERSLGKQLNEVEPQPPFTLMLPIELASHFDQPVLERGPDYYTAHFPLKGLTYAGLQVDSIHLGIGIENGINTRSIRFNAPIAVVKKNFAKAMKNIAALKKRNKNNDIIAEITFNEMSGKGEVVCDTST